MIAVRKERKTQESSKKNVNRERCTSLIVNFPQTIMKINFLFHYMRQNNFLGCFNMFNGNGGWEHEHEKYIKDLDWFSFSIGEFQADKI